MKEEDARTQAQRGGEGGWGREGVGGGRAGHQKREAAPAPAYLAPPATVGAWRGGRREETEAGLAKEPIRCQNEALRRQSLSRTGRGHGLGAGRGYMLNK